MGKLIKKTKFGSGNAAKKIAGKVAVSAIGTLGTAILDGWHGSVEFKNGRELKIKALPADHPYFAVAVERKKGTADMFVTSAIVFTIIAVSANMLVLKTHKRGFAHGNYNRKYS
jgi:hypothetical protein